MKNKKQVDTKRGGFYFAVYDGYAAKWAKK